MYFDYWVPRECGRDYCRSGRLALACFFLMVFVTSARVCAQTVDSRVRLSGFSTLGYGVLRTQDREMSEYMGLGRKGNTARDTKVGINLAVPINSKLSFSGQLVARGKDFAGVAYRDSIAEFDWYFLRYKLFDNLELRAGRQPLPFSLLAETQDVGFLHPWVRPPVEVYSQVQLKSITGVQSRYRYDLGSSGVMNFSIYGGQDYVTYGFNREGLDPVTQKPTVTQVEKAHGYFDSMGGGYINYEYEDLTLMAAYLGLHGVFKADYPYFIPTGQTFAPEAQVYIPFSSDNKIRSSSFGVRWDHPRYLVIAEQRQVDFKDQSSMELKGYYQGYYSTLGIHFGPLTPVMTYSVFRSNSKYKITEFNPLTRSAETVEKTRAGHSSTTMGGVVAALGQNVVWKLEYQVTRNHSKEVFGPFNQTLFPGKTAKVVSSSIDAVF